MNYLMLFLTFLTNASLAFSINGTWKSEADKQIYTIKQVGTFKKDQLPKDLMSEFTNGEFGWITISDGKNVSYDKSGVYFLDDNRRFIKYLPNVNSKDEERVDAYSKYGNQMSRREFPDIYPLSMRSRLYFDQENNEIKFIDTEKISLIDKLKWISSDTRSDFHSGFALYITAFKRYFSK